MTAPNHVIGGIVITGLFGSFLNLNILANPIYIASTIIGALIPDIDYTKSTIGKIFRPISKYLNRRFGHRTITHSILAMFGSFLFLAIIESTFCNHTTVSKIYLIGFFSHLILDMMTVQGVPLFYPFLRNPCVLPGNPNARFKTGNLHSETLFFCFFCVSMIFLQPLFENGFWTQYNRYFGTPKHLASEFHKSPDALNVKYSIKKGTEILKGEGICIAAKENEIVLLEESRFHILNKEKYTILEVIPEHIGIQLLFKTQNFYKISVDSLNALVQKNPIQKIELFANQNFECIQKNIASTNSKVNFKYPEKLFFKVIKTPITSQSFFFPNPKIQTFQKQLEFLFLEKSKSEFSFSQRKETLDSLKQCFYKSEIIIEKEKLFEKIKTLEKTKISIFDYSKIDELQLKITELKKMDGNKYFEQELEAMKIQKEAEVNETTFTGSITFIILN